MVTIVCCCWIQGADAALGRVISACHNCRWVCRFGLLLRTQLHVLLLRAELMAVCAFFFVVQQQSTLAPMLSDS